MQDHKVLLEVLGKEFLIKSDAENIEQLTAATALLKKTALQINAEHPYQSIDRTLVLTALTLAVDYLNLKEDKVNPKDVIKQQIDRIQQQINQALSSESN